jgi:hypothetical protein
MTDPLRDLMGELAEDQPAVADWPGRVRGLVVRRRRRQRVLTAATAVAVLAVGATGVLLAAEGPDRDALVVAADPSSSPSAAVTEGPSAPAPEPSASASPATSYPPSGTQAIEITASGRPTRPTVGQEYALDVVVTGFAEEPPYLQETCYDGGNCMLAIPGCVPREDTSPPPARPQRFERTFRHTFTTAGRHEVQLRAHSGCSYYQGSDELLVVVDVAPEPSPEPSPDPSPNASPEPSPVLVP